MNKNSTIYHQDTQDILTQHFVQACGNIYEAMMDKERNEDYTVNPAQLDFLIQVQDLFRDIASHCGGTVERSLPEPKYRSAGVTGYFPLVSLSGMELAHFCQKLVRCSAVSIDSLEDGMICVSVTVPDVFRKTVPERPHNTVERRDVP